jgi:hypothetical protein
MGLKLERAQELFFSKHLNKLSLILFLHLLNYSFTSITKIIFHA